MISLGIGKIYRANLLAAIVLIWASLGLTQDTLYYYTVSYESPKWGSDIQISKINLETKSIVSELSIKLPGQITSPLPISLTRGGNLLFLITAVDGAPAKNAIADTIMVTNYAVVSEENLILRTGQLTRLAIIELKGVFNDTPVVKIIQQEEHLNRRLTGVISLTDNVPVVRPNESPTDFSTPADSIANVFSLYTINRRNDHIFWGISGGVKLFSLNFNRSQISDSLIVDSEYKYAHLFAMREQDSLIYSFNVNFNIMNGPEESQKTGIDPSFVKILSSDNYSLLDSIPLPDPSSSNGYIMAEYSKADAIGPYFIHYFFTGEDYRYFSPAMLFIFDTRTNEATWLRVGWR